MSYGQLLDWTAEMTERVDRETIVGTHSLHHTSLFTDEALIDIFDHHPRNYMLMATMGDDATNLDEWMNGGPGEVSGQDLLTALKAGRLWLNLVYLQENPVYFELMNDIMDQFGFETKKRSLTLLVSSPNTQVFYHMDPNQVCLFHIRGHKCVYIYPNDNWEIVDPLDLERIFCHEVEEEVPYRPEWERYAEAYDLEPGQFVLWPHNAPHRVVAGNDLNVSLSTVHYTPAALKKEYVYCANRYFRHYLPFNFQRRQITGLRAFIKMHTFRVLRKAGLYRFKAVKLDKKFYVDPQAPQGYRLVSPEEVPETECAGVDL